MDNLLIYLIQSHNSEALKILVEKYRKNIPIWVKEGLQIYNYSHHVDTQIIIDDLEITFYKMLETYNPDKGIFYSYIKGAIYNVIMNHLRHHHRIGITSVSLESEIEEDLKLIDVLSSNDNINRIDERFSLLEEMEEFENSLSEIFEEKDKKIVYLRMQGYLNEEIANFTKTSVRRVNYLLGKVKKL